MRIEARGNRVGGVLCRAGGPGRWLGGVVVAAVGVVAGLVAAVRGLGARPGDLPWAVAGGVLVVAGRVVAFAQAVVGAQWRQRALTAGERALLTSVFHDSLDLDAVRVVPGRGGVFSATRRPFTLGATVYLKDDETPATLVHECVHVWQYQHRGCRYTADALWAQHRVRPSAYRWVDEPARGRRHWREFNVEAQAQFVADIVHRAPGFLVGDTPVFVYGGVDRTDLARAALADLRAGVARPLSGSACAARMGAGERRGRWRGGFW